MGQARKWCTSHRAERQQRATMRCYRGSVKVFFTLTFMKGNMCYDESKCVTMKGISLQSGLRRSCPLRGPHLSVYVSRSEARKRNESWVTSPSAGGAWRLPQAPPLMRGGCRPLALPAPDHLRDASPQPPAGYVIRHRTTQHPAGSRGGSMTDDVSCRWLG